MRSELIDERHLARLAIIYIRQSSPHQVLTNQESLRLQYDLRRRALDLCWREADIVVIDADLGLSGAAAAHREGFKDLIARVALLSNFGPVVLMDFGPPPGPSTLRSPRLNRGTWRGLESQDGFVRATASGA